MTMKTKAARNLVAGDHLAMGGNYVTVAEVDVQEDQVVVFYGGYAPAEYRPEERVTLHHPDAS